MSAAFSGPTGGLGIELYRGAQAYFSRINAQGGVHGARLRLVAYDDGYNPVPAIKNTIRLIEKDNVLLLFNYVGTPTVTRMLPLLKKYSPRRNVFLFFPFTGAEPHRVYPYDRYVFNLRASYQQEIAELVERLVSTGCKRIGVYYQIDAYGRSGWEGVRRALSKYGLKMIGEATYYRGATYDEDMREQVGILASKKPDAIISVGSSAACAAFIRDARDGGLHVPIANVSFVDSENQLKLLLKTGKARGRDYTRNLINSEVVPSYEETSLPAIREYRDLMEDCRVMPPRKLMDRNYEPHRFSPVSLEGFLNAKLLHEILRRLGPNPQASKIKGVVESIDNYDLGIQVPISFAPKKHQGLDEVFLTTVVNRRFVPISDRKGREEE